MDGDTPCEIEGAQLTEPTAIPPYPVHQRIIHKCGPEQAEQHKRAEPHPFGKSARNQSRGDNGEHALIDHEDLMGDGTGINRVRFHAHTSEPEPLQPTGDSPFIRPEGHAVTPQNPFQADQTDDDEALHNGSQRILASHHAGIKQSQSDGHEHDQCSANQNKCGIPRIH